MVALTAISGCSSLEDKLKGKWETVKDDGSGSGTFAEFLSDHTVILSTPHFQILYVYDYKVIEGDRLSIQSKKTREVEILGLRLDQGFLFLKNSDSDREVRYKRV